MKRPNSISGLYLHTSRINTLPRGGKVKTRAAWSMLLMLLLLLAVSCRKNDGGPAGELYIVSVRSGDQFLDLQNDAANTELDPLAPMRIRFSYPLDTATLAGNVQILDAQQTPAALQFSMEDANTLLIAPQPALPYLDNFRLGVSAGLKSTDGHSCTPRELGFSTRAGVLRVDSIISGGQNLLRNPPAQNVDRNFVARVYFNTALDAGTVNTTHVKVFRDGEFASCQLALERSDSTLVITATQPLRHFDRYKIFLAPNLQGRGGYRTTGFTQAFYTAVDPTPKFPVISDDALLDLVQERTFRYFWDFGHPVSGLARERNTSGDIVTTGGSGFGLMAMIVGVERGFITRQEAVQRWKKIVDFLGTKAQRYHGAWAHWLNGSTGQTVPFSTKDNGADLVETSFLVQGMLTVRQYLNPADPEEQQLIQDIQTLWEGVEWDWFTRGGQNVLYWHWSPDYNWDMNLPIRGYNECLITYFLAACSPTHPIAPSVYHLGWAGSGQIVNNKSYYGYTLPLGYDYGGPLFFSHYSWLGLDPRNLKDTYAEYWTQNRNHSLINRAYCIANPLQKVGYGPQCWGLTASDNHIGYNAHSPTNDLGVITPTAALSAFPYTPAESMEALHFFYYQIGDKLWGQYGFYDAFTPTEGWVANSYLAIDQGPIVVMIENHRSGKLWDLFMSAPEVANGGAALGFNW